MGISGARVAERRAGVDGVGPGLLLDANKRPVHAPDLDVDRQAIGKQKRVACLLGGPSRARGLDHGRRWRRRSGCICFCPLAFEGRSLCRGGCPLVVDVLVSNLLSWSETSRARLTGIKNGSDGNHLFDLVDGDDRNEFTVGRRRRTLILVDSVLDDIELHRLDRSFLFRYWAGNDCGRLAAKGAKGRLSLGSEHFA